MTKAAKKAGKPAKPAISPEEAAKKAAAAAAKQSAGKSGEFSTPGDTEGLSAAAKLAVQRAEQNAAQEAEDLSRADEALQLTQVRLLITRDNSRSAIDVFEYEEPVYEKVHGIENVDRIGEREVSVLDWEPASAFDTMLRKFGKNGEKAVLSVYANEAQLARAAGVQYRPTTASRKRDRAGQGALVIDYSKPETVKEISRQRVARVVQ